MSRGSRWVGCWLALGLALEVRAQAPGGNGLVGTYYQGSNFEQYVATRRTATLDFDWHGRSPVAGMRAEQFSARYTGWLVPPATGRYVLHLSVDDGCRLWLNERPLLDDWRSHGLNYYQVALELRAGVAYALRLEYCQQTGPTQLRLAWELPALPRAGGERWASPAHAPAGAVVIAPRYFFSQPPALPPVPQLVQLVPQAAPTPPLPTPASQPAASASVLVLAGRAAPARPRPRSYLPLAARRAAPGPDAEANRVAGLAARLATSQPLTLRTLYFEQGKAALLPPVQASLDTLAQALAERPALRFEVQGHTDNQGDPFINQRLSQQRAAAVCAYLAAHGVAATRLRAVGYGGARPVADNQQPDQRPRNRRVVFKPLGH